MRERIFGVFVALFGCGGGGEDGATMQASEGSSSTTTGTGSTSSSGTAPTSGAATAPTGSSGSETTSEPGTGASTGPGTTSDGTTGEQPLDCSAVSRGPWALQPFVTGASGSTDLAFDGEDRLALGRDASIVLMAADKSYDPLADGLPPFSGMRFLADGRLLAAGVDEIVAIDAGGAVDVFADGFSLLQGLHVDFAGNVWVAATDELLRISPDMTVTQAVDTFGQDGLSSVVYDEQRGVVFFSDAFFEDGLVSRAEVDAEGNVGTSVEVWSVADNRLRGLTLDACGNLYFLDRFALTRLLLDETGALPGSEQVQLLVSFQPDEYTGASFGAGDGFDARTLYLVGPSGAVSTLALEFPGAPMVAVK